MRSTAVPGFAGGASRCGVPGSGYALWVVDWTVVSSLATAAGTLVLAVATFASVRSANRAARASERALLAGLRPVLMPSRLQDPTQKVGFADNHWVHAPGGAAVVDVTDEAIYMVMSLRNAGNGIAVLHGWTFRPGLPVGVQDHSDPATFRRLTRDIFVPAGDVGFWQGAFREPGSPDFLLAKDAIERRLPLTIELLYGDHQGGQRTISLFSMRPRDDGGWITSVSRHWNLEGVAPR